METLRSYAQLLLREEVSAVTGRTADVLTEAARFARAVGMTTRSGKAAADSVLLEEPQVPVVKGVAGTVQFIGLADQ
jgi:hypothetical protein